MRSKFKHRLGNVIPGGYRSSATDKQKKKNLQVAANEEEIRDRDCEEDYDDQLEFEPGKNDDCDEPEEANPLTEKIIDRITNFLTKP